jgi:hypothetical protein
MRMSPFGFGKALYIKLDSGQLVVYAHLSRFAEPMAGRARSEQKRRRRYTFDIELPPGEMRVTRGQVIAWSGQTGVGFPHLHFEMRDGDVARNPQTSGFAVRDTIAPVVAEVLAMPLDAQSHVGGGLETRRVPLEPATRGATASSTLVVGGRIGFAARAWDHTTSREYRQGPYRYELRVDGKTLFRLVNERVDYNDNHLLVLEYDQERLVEKGERVQLLYLRPGNRLLGREAPEPGGGVMVTSDPQGVAPFAPGEHTVEVEVADVAGNVTVRRGRVVASGAPSMFVSTAWDAEQLRWYAVAKDDDLKNGGERLEAQFELSRDEGARWEALHEVDERIDPGVTPYVQWRGEVRWDGRTPLRLRARVRDRAGLDDVATWVGPEDSNGMDWRVRPVWRPWWVELGIEARGRVPGGPPTLFEFTREIETRGPASGSRPLLFTREGACICSSGCPIHEMGTGRWQVIVPFDRCGTWLEVALGGQSDGVEIPVRARIVSAGKPARVDDLEPGLVVDIPAGALLEDVALRVEKRRPATLGMSPELSTAGPCLVVEPRTAALDKQIQVSLGPADSTHVGLFWINRGGDLRLLASERGADGAITGETRYLSTFALLRDTTPPRIGPVQVTSRGKRPQRLRFTVRDEGARMGDGGIEVELDGAFAIPEWDPETGEVILEPETKLPPGAHRLRITATDQLGNRAERTVRFQVP